MLLRWGELGFDVATQVLQAFGGDPRPLPGLGQDEGALEHRLDMEREAPCAPRRIRRVAALGFGDDLGNLRRVRADVRVARGPNVGVRVVGLLDHRAEQAGELRQRALQDRDAEIHVTQQPVERVGDVLVGGGCKQTVGHRREMGRRGKRQLLLGVEVMEETALGETGGFADVFDARRRIPFGPDDVQGGVEEPDLGFVLCFGRVHCMLMSQRTAPYRLVGILSSRRRMAPGSAPERQVRGTKLY